jgi:hypothetical protein
MTIALYHRSRSACDFRTRVSAKMLCICVKEPYIFTQKTYPSAKEPNMYPQKKLYMYPQKSPIFIYQTALYLSAKEPHTRMQTRKDLGPKYDLYLPISISKKSPAYIRQEALYISAKEPHTRTHKKTWSQVVSVCLYIYQQKSPICIHKKVLYISAKEPYIYLQKSPIHAHTHRPGPN